MRERTEQHSTRTVSNPTEPHYCLPSPAVQRSPHALNIDNGDVCTNTVRLSPRGKLGDFGSAAYESGLKNSGIW